MLNLFFEAGLGIFKGLIDALAAGIVFPTVIGTADAVGFDEAVVERHAAMGTLLGD